MAGNSIANEYGTFNQRNSQDRQRTRVGANVLRILVVVGAVVLASGMLIAQQHAASGTASDARDLNAVEQQFMDGVSRTQLREHLKQYASTPHRAGTAQDYATAVFTAEQWNSFGIDTEIQEYYPLLSSPTQLRVAIVEPPAAARDLDLREAAVDGDSCTSDSDVVAPYLSYAASGNVTSAIVYVNYGTAEDFKWLVSNGVKLEGKIALARYAKNYRGLKVMLAEQYGMLGVLIYSDPFDDGFVHGKTYPDGPWRPGGSFQRGSAMFLSYYPGDPLTPGYAAGSEQLSLANETLAEALANATNIPHIPATALSSDQAQYILQSLGGTKAPSEWQGGLSLSNGAYYVGDDGTTIVNLDLEIHSAPGPIWNVVGVIPGTVEPEHHVMIGNHRDAWVCGAVDPSSGSASLLEIARNLGALLATGWRPRRTIVLTSWDGEEPGLLGSTEYAEDKAADIQEHVVAYINVDHFKGSAVTASATPSIAAFLHQTARSVPPVAFNGVADTALGHRSLYDQWVAQTHARIEAFNGSTGRTLAPDFLINLLGSGTDFTPFYQHLGIISADLGFNFDDIDGVHHGITNGLPYAVYHSSMDSISFVDKYADPDYASHAAMTQWWGLLVLRLADHILLPFDFSTYASVMKHDLDNLASQTSAADLSVTYDALYGAIDEFGRSAQQFLDAISGSDLKDKTTVDKWNSKLVALERHFLLDSGLPHRTWFKHVIFGPGFYEGYAGTAFPGVADALAFQDSADVIQAHVDEVTQLVKEAARVLVG
ncbi:TPA: hypothetical protein N0F65_003881 [Lagenidium giganteum]|uniref:Glutamate carboxypeptidase n=1 Tax=Lagenidium giganteum TaxID=4803 RepID=A0AAV2Z731_9STRA|nr:TPA: hypothetical protein N0F65_003881 [Lagenidium giganteum]